jgi:hypothetical protein
MDKDSALSTVKSVVGRGQLLAAEASSFNVWCASAYALDGGRRHCMLLVADTLPVNEKSPAPDNITRSLFIRNTALGECTHDVCDTIPDHGIANPCLPSDTPECAPSTTKSFIEVRHYECEASESTCDMIKYRPKSHEHERCQSPFPLDIGPSVAL